MDVLSHICIIYRTSKYVTNIQSSFPIYRSVDGFGKRLISVPMRGSCTQSHSNQKNAYHTAKQTSVNSTWKIEIVYFTADVYLMKSVYERTLNVNPVYDVFAPVPA